jgi:hypothetical protein
MNVKRNECKITVVVLIVRYRYTCVINGDKITISCLDTCRYNPVKCNGTCKITEADISVMWRLRGRIYSEAKI